MRVVLDTGVVVSALLFAGKSLSWIRHGWTQRDFVPLVSRATTEELFRVLFYPKFELSHEEIEAVLAAYLPFAEVVRIRPGQDSALPLATDADDQKFLELAEHGGADLLVSGDRHLLSLAGRVRFEIVTPGRFRGHGGRG